MNQKQNVTLASHWAKDKYLDTPVEKLHYFAWDYLGMNDHQQVKEGA